MLNRRVGELSLSVIGLGTYDLAEQNMKKVISDCVSRGVNFIDSANRYGNEAKIATTISSLGLKREDVVIGTKLSYKQQISQSVCESVDESLNELKTDYIDLYMIHSPKSKTYCDDWMNLQAERKKGKIIETAVSNFSIEQLQNLHQVSGIYPVLNQIEVNLIHVPWKLIYFCRKHNIVVQASCPLYRMGTEAVNNKAVKDIMSKYNKSYAQIVLRWLFQREMLSIPKMSTLKHVEENIDIFGFDLAENDIMWLEKNAGGVDLKNG